MRFGLRDEGQLRSTLRRPEPPRHRLPSHETRLKLLPHKLPSREMLRERLLCKRPNHKSLPRRPQRRRANQLRHESVGMMFAVAIGEVGVQTASLVRAGDWVHFLPAYSHLFLTTIVIATSWVGWTLSPAPGARRDVRSLFNRDFLVLLVDVFLVVVYFILAKTVDLAGEKELQLNASARPETLWILVIFGTYIFWDVLSQNSSTISRRGLKRTEVKPRRAKSSHSKNGSKSTGYECFQRSFASSP